MLYIISGSSSISSFIKTKNSKLRQLAIPAAISGLFGGTSEPALYGISVKMKNHYMLQLLDQQLQEFMRVLYI